MVRLVRGPSAPGPRQMALDVAMAQWAVRHQEAVVRVYRFSPPTVSLGRFQPAEEVHLPGVRELGAGLCRRPTGGQAVFHDDEVTYALACPRSFLPENVLDSYERIAHGLSTALAALGVAAEVTVRQAPVARMANCFVWPAPAELTVGGRKLVGSAQCRLGAAFLQHGAVPLTLARERWAAVFAPAAARQAVVEAMRLHATSLAEALGRRPDAREVEAALLAGLASVFGGGAAPLAAEELAALLPEEEPYLLPV
jgi:lipoate-protein ligase A